MPDYKTEDNISIITSKPLTVFIAAFFISLIFSNLFLLIFLVFKYTFNLQIFLIGIVIFIISLASMLLIKTEFLLAIKNDYGKQENINNS